MHEDKIIRRYYAELGGAMFLYVLVLTVSIAVGQPMPKASGVRCCWSVPWGRSCWRHGPWRGKIRRGDEYCRLKVLEAIAIAAAVTAGWTFTYGFLENAGFPRLSMFTVWPVMGAVWAVVAMVRWWSDR
jgi:hypothetical protein